MKKNKATKILLSGGSFSGNLGAQAMYDSIIDELREHISEIEVSVLSKYPEDDKEGCKQRGYKLIPFPTTKQLVVGGLFYIFGGLLKLVHLPYRWLAGKTLKPYFENDILVDASGIAFTDDRSFTNVLINALWFLPAIVSGIPIVKVSQTLGPYKKWYVKIFSNMVLKHVDYIVCRGKQSFDYTNQYLKKENVYNLPDTAFCLKPADERITDDLLGALQVKRNEYIAVGPSFVMRDYLEKGVYAQIFAETINKLNEQNNMPFVFVPHSWKHSEKLGVDSVNDDYTVCRDIVWLLNQDVKYSIVDHEMSAREFKSIIGNAYLTIGSRYHFLIAALSSGVPSMALGWSHKYKELFGEFQVEEYVLEYKNMALENVLLLAKQLLNNRDELFAKINILLPSVKAQSAENEKLVVKCLSEKGKI